MWTEITRKQYERNNGRYASDLTDEQGDSVKIVVAFGQEADRRCSAGPERLDSPCGRVADALEHSTCGAVSVKMFCGA